MGTIRLLLALSVVLCHVDPAGPMLLVGGGLAVRLFFIISGFYMAMILTEKYTGSGSARAFYQNRLLRLLPTYYVVLLIPLVIHFVVRATGHPGFSFGSPGVWTNHGEQLGTGAKLLLGAANIGVLGQEFTWLYDFDPASHAFAPHSASTPHALPSFYFLLNPPSWSLSLELGFYLLAPWILRRSWTHVGIALAAAIGLRLGLLHWAPAGPEFWTTHFLPGELAYFLAGSFAYKVASRFSQLHAHRRSDALAPWMLGLVLASLVTYPWLRSAAAEVFCEALLAAALPFIFRLTANRPWDQWLGNLSYPVYLVHWNILLLIPAGLKHLPFSDIARTHVFQLAGVALSLAAAACIVRWVERPVEQLRHQITARLAPVQKR